MSIRFTRFKSLNVAYHLHSDIAFEYCLHNYLNKYDTFFSNRPISCMLHINGWSRINTCLNFLFLFVNMLVLIGISRYLHVCVF